VKKAIIFIIVGVVLGGGLVFLKMRPAGAHAATDADDKAAAGTNTTADTAGTTQITHDTNGNVVISISDDTRKDMGLQVTNPAAATYSPELKGYGHVEDTAALAAAVSEVASDEAAYAASSNELERLKTLAGQGNASARALQAAQATAEHDLLAIQAARDHLLLSTTPALMERGDLSGFVQSLTERKAALVRIDLPADEVPSATPLGARLVSLSGDRTDGEFLGVAAATDPGIQGRGYFFLVTSNAPDFTPGQAVTGYLKLPGDAVQGVVVPRDSVVRVEGAGWVYVQNAGAKSFTRTTVPLDRPAEDGWFVTNGLSAGDSIVATGAQTLLSEELKGALHAD
jgi:hypothetical protein